MCVWGQGGWGGSWVGGGGGGGVLALLTLDIESL